MSLLILENIVKEYRNQTVLNGVSLRVEKGERLVLIGPNGAGKTTLLKIAMGFEKSDEGSVTIARNIKVGYLTQDLKDIKQCSTDNTTALHYENVYRLERKLRELENQMSTLNEDSSSELFRSLMNDYSRMLVRYEAMDGYTIETKIKKMLLGLGLRAETLYTPIDKLSGGEKMRVAVARILLEEPDLLILDEPTNHLDIQATEWFENFLKRFEGGILLVSHDRYFLDRVATRVAELENGSICVRSGNYSSYMEHKRQLSQFISSEQRRLRWSIKNTNQIVQGLKSRGNISASKSRQKEMHKLEYELKTNMAAIKGKQHLHKIAGPSINFKKVKHVSKDIAWAENLSKRFGETVLLNGAGFHIRGGERIGIIGPNGCGKTTLINMLLGLDTDYQGHLRLGDWVKYSYMGQQVLFDNNSMTILEFIMSVIEMPEAEARNYLSRFQFYGDVVDKSIGVLSGGEQVRLYLACVVLEDSDCLILDEPTNHLDVSARDAVEKALIEFKGTIIAITHDRYYLTHCVGRILEFENGLINSYEGNYDLYRQIKYGIDLDDIAATSAKPGPATTRNSNKAKYGCKNENPVKSQQNIEGQIAGLEEQIKEMEDSFDKSTSPETYREYTSLLNIVDELYEEWNQLIE